MTPAIPNEVIDLLRCPLAVQEPHGDEKGKLKLVRGCWLVCESSQMKYPIVQGIPVLLIEEGQKWRDIPESELPVPPPEL
jgi:hypothetical protein